MQRPTAGEFQHRFDDEVDVRGAALCMVADEAGEWLLAAIQPGDVVLVKGSRGIALERAVEKLVSREVAR